MASWRARADTFPVKLVTVLVEQALAPEVLTGWPAREALVSRGDSLAIRDLLTRTGHAAVRAILALNRVYLPHRQLKWQHHLTTGLSLAPGRLAERPSRRPGQRLPVRVPARWSAYWPRYGRPRRQGAEAQEPRRSNRRAGLVPVFPGPASTEHPPSYWFGPYPGQRRPPWLACAMIGPGVTISAHPG
jgi:hypothetical protein